MAKRVSGRAVPEAALSPLATEPVPVSALAGNDQPRFKKNDLLRYRTSEFPCGFVRSTHRDGKGVFYIVGFGRGRSKTECMARDIACELVRPS